MNSIKYGQKIVDNFDVDKDLEVWKNEYTHNYKIKIELPEFTCLCPRSGYPDFGSIFIEYYPDDKVIELKSIKLYINSFRNRSISHEGSANEIYLNLKKILNPKKIKLIADFYPRGNVHTIIEIDSED